jgi:CBS domain-containing protein
MTVAHEIMTSRLFNLWPGDTADEALLYLQMLNIHSAPVLDETTHEPVGVISVSDLTGSLDGVSVTDRMTVPAIVTNEGATVTDVATTLVRNSLHHMPVVDAKNRAVGFVSILDVVTALLDPHKASRSYGPIAYPGVEWSEQQPLSDAGLLAAPDGPGVFVLLRVQKGRPDTVLWLEDAEQVRERLQSLRAEPPPRWARYLETDRLRFCAAPIAHISKRREVVRAFLERGTLGAARRTLRA